MKIAKFIMNLILIDAGSGDHNVSACSIQEKKCVNCISANKYLKNKRPISHSADDINVKAISKVGIVC